MAKAKATKAAKPEVTEVTVTWKDGSRVYSHEIHGEHFHELAKQLAAQHPEAVIS